MSETQIWFLSRGSGMMLLVITSLTIILGILASVHKSSALWPRFLTQGLHRNLAFFTVALTLIHGGVSVISTFVDIKIWDVFIPFIGSYKTFWMGLGTLAFDISLAAIITSLMRARIGLRWWRIIHLTTYLAFPIAVIHGLGIGTDSVETWGLTVTIGCLLTVMAAIAVRLSNRTANK